MNVMFLFKLKQFCSITVFGMCIISFCLFSLIPDLVFSMLVIMSVVPILGMLLYMFSMSNEHILMSLLLFMVLNLQLGAWKLGNS
jgi:hypothetical protein